MNAVVREHALPGRILLRSLPAVPAVSWYQYAPAQPQAGAPIIVAMHGISRNAREQAALFLPVAQRHRCVLIAPRFDREHYRGFQQLGLDGAGRRADLDLLAILSHVADELGVPAGPVHIAGFSGGAQFAHRFALLYPERVARLVLGAAGWYTWPDESLAYPYGMGAGGGLAAPVASERLCRIPMLVAVGTRDTQRDRSLRSDEQLDALQGRTRVERARRWVAAINTVAASHGLAPAAELALIRGCGHSFKQMMTRGGLAGLALRFLLAPLPPTQ